MVDYDRVWQEHRDLKRLGPASRHTQRLVLRELGRLAPFESVCDVGCGDGALLRLISGRWPTARLYGLDLSPEAVDRARSSGAELRVGDIARGDLPWRCDVAVCSEVLEHLDDDVGALRNIGQGAEQLVVTTVGGPLTADLREAGHVRHYTRRSLREALEQAGWEAVRVFAWGFPCYNLYRLALAGGAAPAAKGTYGGPARLACLLLYWVLFLDLPGRGWRLVAAARRRGGQVGRREEPGGPVD